jgi:hypothetical protein
VAVGLGALTTECGGALPPPEHAARITDTAANTVAAVG